MVDRRVAITGANGQLGRQLVDAFRKRGDEVRPLTRPAFDLRRPRHEELLTWRPDVVINSAAWTDVDGCARDPALAMALNGDAAGEVARVGATAGALVVQISTNEVFDGLSDRPYTEHDEPNPINAYGASKLRGEELTIAATDRSLVVRTAWLFGPGGTNFVTKIIAAAERALSEARPLSVVDDEWGNPTWAPDLASAIVEAVDRGRTGVIHLAGMPPATRFAWAEVCLDAVPLKIQMLGVPGSSFRRASRVPPRATLSPTIGLGFDWQNQTRTYVADLRSAIPAENASTSL
ncbi:MAG TPA: NAD(P)-dependent oxidoreductase [Nitrolancea sp.]